MKRFGATVLAVVLTMTPTITTVEAGKEKRRDPLEIPLLELPSSSSVILSPALRGVGSRNGKAPTAFPAAPENGFHGPPAGLPQEDGEERGGLPQDDGSPSSSAGAGAPPSSSVLLRPAHPPATVILRAGDSQPVGSRKSDASTMPYVERILDPYAPLRYASGAEDDGSGKEGDALDPSVRSLMHWSAEKAAEIVEPLFPKGKKGRKLMQYGTATATGIGSAWAYFQIFQNTVYDLAQVKIGITDSTLRQVIDRITGPLLLPMAIAEFQRSLHYLGERRPESCQKHHLYYKKAFYKNNRSVLRGIAKALQVLVTIGKASAPAFLFFDDAAGPIDFGIVEPFFVASQLMLSWRESGESVDRLFNRLSRGKTAQIQAKRAQIANRLQTAALDLKSRPVEEIDRLYARVFFPPELQDVVLQKGQEGRPLTVEDIVTQARQGDAFAQEQVKIFREFWQLGKDDKPPENWKQKAIKKTIRWASWGVSLWATYAREIVVEAALEGIARDIVAVTDPTNPDPQAPQWYKNMIRFAIAPTVASLTTAFDADKIERAGMRLYNRFATDHDPFLNRNAPWMRKSVTILACVLGAWYAFPTFAFLLSVLQKSAAVTTIIVLPYALDQAAFQIGRFEEGYNDSITGLFSLPKVMTIERKRDRLRNWLGRLYEQVAYLPDATVHALHREVATAELLEFKRDPA